MTQSEGDGGSQFDGGGPQESCAAPDWEKLEALVNKHGGIRIVAQVYRAGGRANPSFNTEFYVLVAPDKRSAQSPNLWPGCKALAWPRFTFGRSMSRWQKGGPKGALLAAVASVDRHIDRVDEKERDEQQLAEQFRQFRASLTQFSLVNLIEGRVSMWRRAIGGGSDGPGMNLKLSVDLPRETPEPYGDAASVTMILDDLMYNAFRNSHQNGSLSLAVRTTEDHVSISLEDCGAGIPVQIQEIMPGRPDYSMRHREIGTENSFRAFKELEAARKSGVIGVGLRLAANLAKAMDARLEFESALCKGSTFTLVLPRHTTPVPKVGAR